MSADNEFGFDISHLKVYSGFIKDKDQLVKSASGGAATKLAEAVIKKGGVVFGAGYTPDYRQIVYYCIDNIPDLEKIKGSKYAASSKKVYQNGELVPLYDVVEEKLKAGLTVLFVGLGCDIGALRKNCELRNFPTENLYAAELLCHGPSRAIAHEKFIDELEAEHKSKVTYYNARYKKDGRWFPPFVHVEFENGDLVEKQLFKNDFGIAFMKYSNPGCFNCQFKGPNHAGDVCLGDYWGITEEMPGYNINGVSIIFVQRPRGDELLKLFGEDFSLNPADLNLALRGNGLYYKLRKKDEDYDVFDKNLREHGLHYAVMQSLTDEEKKEFENNDNLNTGSSASDWAPKRKDF